MRRKLSMISIFLRLDWRLAGLSAVAGPNILGFSDENRSAVSATQFLSVASGGLWDLAPDDARRLLKLCPATAYQNRRWVLATHTGPAALREAALQHCAHPRAHRHADRRSCQVRVSSGGDPVRPDRKVARTTTPGPRQTACAQICHSFKR